MNEIEREKIRLYLLGELDPEGQRRIEELLVTSRSIDDELSMAEDELTDQYLANELSESEHENFERHFLCAPERLKKLRFARALKRHVNPATETVRRAAIENSLAVTGEQVEARSKKPPFFSFLPIRSPVIAYSFAAAVFLTVIGISWLVFSNLTTRPQKPGGVLLVSLKSGLTRAPGERKTLQIPPGIDSAQLQLELEAEEHQTYRAELWASERDAILLKEGLRPETIAGKKVINVTIPAALLKRDDYRVKLSGSLPNGSYEDIASYPFRVVE